MAETNQTISGTVLFETDDDLSETNLGAAAAQGNAVDYVVRGCGFSVNHTNDTITIGSTGTRANYAIIENPSNHVAYNVYPDQETDIALPTSTGTNHVFIDYDPSTDTAEYHIDDDDTAPAEPSLKIGTVDTANDTSTETNRDPSVSSNGGDLAPDQLDVLSNTDNSTNTFVQINETGLSTGYSGYLGLERQTGVSTSPTSIWDMSLLEPGGSRSGGGTLTVSGKRQGSSERFSDIVHYSRLDDPQVVNSIETNTPDSRTYARSGTDIQLNMSANTYNVVTEGSTIFTEG